ncbi:MAG: endolytic transglycosylase MltG, partial [Dethiobacteria bacterium]|nr:endolytic transglycosylase MltG [Dethiobacteria bacterium]
MLRRIIVTLVILFILTIGAAYALNVYYTGLLEPVDPAARDSEVLVEIPAGANTEIIAVILFDAGLIQNELAFRLFVRQNNLGQGFKAGTYSLNPAMSVSQIAAKIESGDVYSETVWFTIPEGFSLKDIAARLEENGLGNAEKFLSLARKPSEAILTGFPFLQEINNQSVDYLLEGYLFPDTYEVYPNVSEEEIIVMMLNRLNRVFTAEHKERIVQLNSSLHQILTIAAMVEREGRVDHERALIAGVIYNRLRIGMRLQIDATIQYALGETKEFLTFKDLEIESAYNTYQNDGLPPGPIASPGEASIIAALYPEASDYLYYNYKYDQSGEHYFSHTFAEH